MRFRFPATAALMCLLSTVFPQQFRSASVSQIRTTITAHTYPCTSTAHNILLSLSLLSVYLSAGSVWSPPDTEDARILTWAILCSRYQNICIVHWNNKFLLISLSHDTGFWFFLILHCGWPSHKKPLTERKRMHILSGFRSSKTNENYQWAVGRGLSCLTITATEMYKETKWQYWWWVRYFKENAGTTALGHVMRNFLPKYSQFFDFPTVFFSLPLFSLEHTLSFWLWPQCLCTVWPSPLPRASLPPLNLLSRLKYLERSMALAE